VKPHRIVAGPLRGARIVTSWHDYPASIMGRTERDLLDWFQYNVKPGETWLDVGAHYGYTAIALARFVGPKGRVFTFEPVIATAGCVAQTRILNALRHLMVVPLGLGSPESIESLDLPTTRGMADRTLDVPIINWHETIHVVRFDWLWPHINGGRHPIDGVKIDVQGMELEVLQGMQQALSRYRPKLVIEFHRGVDRKAIFALLMAAGYRTDVIPIERQHSWSLSVEAFLDDRSYEFLPAGGEQNSSTRPPVAAAIASS
jgi:FkbM family methyltransferase